MRSLVLVAQRAEFLRSLSIGSTINVEWNLASGPVRLADVYTAEVIEQRPSEEEGQADVLVQMPLIAGGQIVMLHHADAESPLVKVHDRLGWFAVAEQQPLYYEEAGNGAADQRA